jgi:hypothetical protein
MKAIWTILITVVATAAVVGGGTYYLINKSANKDKSDLQAQIDDLNVKVSSVAVTSGKTVTSGTTVNSGTTVSTGVAATTGTTAVNPTAGWKTYTNATYGFSVEYPSGATIVESKEDYNDARSLLITFSNEYVIEVLNKGNQTPLDFVNSYYGGWEGGPSEIKSDSINSLSVVKFFMQKAAINSDAGSAYILFSKGATAVALQGKESSPTDGASDQILNLMSDSFQFTK